MYYLKAEVMYHVTVRTNIRPFDPRPAVAKRSNNEAIFKRLVETSDAMRHACGFDSELFAAMQGLAAR